MKKEGPKDKIDQTLNAMADLDISVPEEWTGELLERLPHQSPPFKVTFRQLLAYAASLAILSGLHLYGSYHLTHPRPNSSIETADTHYEAWVDAFLFTDHNLVDDELLE